MKNEFEFFPMIRLAWFREDRALLFQFWFAFWIGSWWVVSGTRASRIGNEKRFSIH